MQNILFLLSSIDNNPLKYWTKQQSLTGSIHTVLDQHLLQNVIELRDRNSNNYGKTSITCPIDSTKTLNIKLPFLVFIIKYCDNKCLFKLQLIDKNKHRYFLHFYNAKCEKHYIKIPNVQIVEVNYEQKWNKIELDLPKLVWQAFQTSYEAIQRVQVCGNCRLRRIYCIDKHYTEFEISTKLCKNFFDFYMSKWGNLMVERFTQTEKNKCSFHNNNDKMSIIYMNVSESEDKMKKFRRKLNQDKYHKAEANFTKLLRATCRNKIDNFFNMSTKSACCLKNPKLDSLSTSGVEKQKVLLATIKFINEIQNTHFAFLPII